MRDYPLVTPKFEREPDNAPGPFYVIRGQCILCALPVETASQSITWDAKFQQGGRIGCPNHCRVEHQPQTPDEIARVIEAACSSCVEAVRYCGTDPSVLGQFRERGLERLCDAL